MGEDREQQQGHDVGDLDHRVHGGAGGVLIGVAGRRGVVRVGAFFAPRRRSTYRTAYPRLRGQLYTMPRQWGLEWISWSSNDFDIAFPPFDFQLSACGSAGSCASTILTSRAVQPGDLTADSGSTGTVPKTRPDSTMRSIVPNARPNMTATCFNAASEPLVEVAKSVENRRRADIPFA